MAWCRSCSRRGGVSRWPFWRPRPWWSAFVADAARGLGAAGWFGREPEPGVKLVFTATAYCKGTTTASGVAVRRGIAAADPQGPAGGIRGHPVHGRRGVRRRLHGDGHRPRREGPAAGPLRVELSRGAGLRPQGRGGHRAAAGMGSAGQRRHAGGPPVPAPERPPRTQARGGARRHRQRTPAAPASSRPAGGSPSPPPRRSAAAPVHPAPPADAAPAAPPTAEGPG